MSMQNDIYSIDIPMTSTKIRKSIAKRGLSIKELQAKLNLSCPQPIYRWISGQTLPSLDNMYMLSEILGVHMEDLILPRNNYMWVLRIQKNLDMNKRMKAYYEKVNANG